MLKIGDEVIPRKLIFLKNKYKLTSFKNKGFVGKVTDRYRKTREVKLLIVKGEEGIGRTYWVKSMFFKKYKPTWKKRMLYEK